MAGPNLERLEARPDALPLLARWYSKEWGDPAGAWSPERALQELRQAQDSRGLPTGVIASQAGRTIGVARLVDHEMDIYPEKEHWLGGVYVVEGQRGQGIATRLVEAALRVARSLGIETLYLQTTRLDGGLYARLGWQPLEEVDYHGSHVLVMARQVGAR